ncbi:MAG TPA: hypothetical protein VE715_04985 [Blastocatellia bacterium]|nr:hypothetical protein [Blastocatellia bacterium]
MTTAEFEAGLDTIRQSPKNEGIIAMIVRRPQVDEREVLEEGDLVKKLLVRFPEER